MNTRSTASLLSAIHLSFASVVWAAEPACKIVLDQRPELGALTAAGLKFLNPERIEFLWNKYDSGKFDLSCEATTIDLEFGGAKVNLATSKIGAEIFKEDLVQPGKYYPPQPPAGDHSKVGQLSISVSDRSAEDVQELASELAKLLKLDESKVSAWFSNRMWEGSPSLVLASPMAASPDKSHTPSVRLTTSKIWDSGQADRPLWFGITVNLSWSKETEQGVAPNDR